MVHRFCSEISNHIQEREICQPEGGIYPMEKNSTCAEKSREDAGMNIITVRNMTKKYGEKTVLDNISFTIPAGETVAVVGPNGTGKTTLLEILMTIRKADNGTVSIMGKNTNEQKSVDEIRSRIGVMLQEGGMYSYIKLKEALDLFASFYSVGKDKTEQLAEYFELKPYLNTKFDKLSGGWKQRFLLAIAFLHDPDLIFLDEPTTGLDPKATQLVWEKIRSGAQKDKTILVSTHSMEEVDKYCDRVIVLNKGKIVENDVPAAIKEKLNVSFFSDAYFMLVEGGEKR